MTKTIDVVVDLNPTQPAPAIPGWNSALPEREDPEREARNRAATRRATENYQEWQRKHELWLQQQQSRRDAASAGFSCGTRHDGGGVRRRMATSDGISAHG